MHTLEYLKITAGSSNSFVYILISGPPFAAVTFFGHCLPGLTSYFI